MNNEKLWNALGEVGEDLISEAETRPKRNFKKRTAVILAAAIIVLFSVTAIAMQYLASFEEIFGSVRYYEVENYENAIGTDVYSEEGNIRFSAVSALADERVCMVLWQVENTKGNFAVDESYAETTLSVGENNTSLSLYYGSNEAPKNILMGYEFAEVGSEQQNFSGKLSLEYIYYLVPNGYSGYITTPYIETDLSMDFSIEKRMTSTVLKTADPNIKISCSPISMSIEGLYPEYDPFDINNTLYIFLKDGHKVELISNLNGIFVNHEPFDPNDVVSILYNGVELLA